MPRSMLLADDQARRWSDTGVERRRRRNPFGHQFVMDRNDLDKVVDPIEKRGEPALPYRPKSSIHRDKTCDMPAREQRQSSRTEGVERGQIAFFPPTPKRASSWCDALGDASVGRAGLVELDLHMQRQSPVAGGNMTSRPRRPMSGFPRPCLSVS